MIGVDAHELEPHRAGVARYLREALRALSEIPAVRERWRFPLFSPSSVEPDSFLENEMFEKTILKSRSYALFLMALLPYAACRRKVDLLWFPSYQLPYTWRGRALVTIDFPRSNPVTAG